MRRSSCLASAHRLTPLQNSQTRRTKQSTVTELSPYSFQPLRLSAPRLSRCPGGRLRFAVPARIAHPGWRVSQARSDRPQTTCPENGLAVELSRSGLAQDHQYLSCTGAFLRPPLCRYCTAQPGYIRNLFTVARARSAVNCSLGIFNGNLPDFSSRHLFPHLPQ